MKAIITVGVSASGKTTWAKEYAQKHKAIISNRDDLRFSLTGAKDWSEYKFDSKIEKAITEIQHRTFFEASVMKKDFILSDTNLDAARRDSWTDVFKSAGYDVEIHPFHISLEEAWKRDGLRANGVGRDVIYKQYKQWLKFIGRKTYTPNESLPKAVIFDVDGTLAHMNGRKPFEWGSVGSDLVDVPVREMFYAAKNNGYKTIILSGRDGCCKEETHSWLVDNGITPWNEFIIREIGDTRKDTIIKEEIFWRDIAPYYNVRVVVDDRPVVCRMWREIGIPKVVQVGDPHEEF